MEIHKPKPWHGAREFLKEYVIIVVGVLTALGAEQAVEWLHWRHEVAETRATLAGEISRNIERLTREQQLAPCVEHRLDDVHRYLAGRAPGDRSLPPAKVGVRRGLLRLNTNAWETAKAAQLMAHMPVAERDRYSRLYNEFDFAASSHMAEADTLTVIRLVEDAPMLEAADWSQVRLAWNRAAIVEAQQDRNLSAIIADARAIVGPRSGAEAARGPANAVDRQQDVLSMNGDLCRPWYPPAPATAR